MNVKNKPRELFRYVVNHDMGFAPNPFFGVCTLACCKPNIRKAASPGDVVVGYGSKNSGNRGRLVYWMTVDEVTTFDEYWTDPRFYLKRPQFGASLKLTFGDNIYHRNETTGGWIQEKSFHSDPQSLIGLGNLQNDTAYTDQVLIGSEYTYWGGSGPFPPPHFKPLMEDGVREIRKITNRSLADEFIEWLEATPERGFRFDPAMWSHKKKLKQYWAPEKRKC